MKYKIVRNKRKGYIRPHPHPSLANALEKHCSYEKKNSEFIPNPDWRVTKLYNKKYSSFPMGLLSKVKRIMDKWVTLRPEDSYELDDLTIKNTYHQIVPKTLDYPIYLRPYQKDAVKALLDNNGGILCKPTGCVDADTEFLTPTGWKKISEYNGTEKVMQYNLDGTSEFVIPLNYIKIPEKKLWHFKSKYGINQCLSDEHKVLYVNDSKMNYIVKPFHEVKRRHEKNKTGFSGKFITTFKPQINTEIPLNEWQLRVMVAVIADGSFPTHTKYCCLNLKREDKICRAKALLDKAHIPFKTHRVNDFTRITFQAPRRKKVYDVWFWKASQEQLRVIADECLYWDGSTQNRERFFTSKKESADFIQYCFSSTGHRARIKKYVRKARTMVRNGKEYEYDDTIEYSVLRTKRILPTIESSVESIPIKEYETRDGYKYCFSVPSGFLVLRRGGCIFATGNSGKTRTTIGYLEMMQQPTLVIVPTLVIKKQWKDQVGNYVDVMTYQSIKNFQILKKYKIIVFDECHHCSAITLYKISMALDGQIVVGLSATPKREDGEDMKMFGALGDIVYEISIRELIEQGYLCDANVEWLDVEEPPYIHNYQDSYRALIVENDLRNEKICNKVSTMTDKKILILVGQIEHGKKLKEILNDMGVDDVTFIYSKTKKIDLSPRILIATSIFDEGFDLPAIDVIVMGGGGKSSIKVTQRIGRALRPHEDKGEALILDIRDRGKHLYHHYIQRKLIYDSFGFKSVN